MAYKKIKSNLIAIEIRFMLPGVKKYKNKNEIWINCSYYNGDKTSDYYKREEAVVK